MLRELEGGAGGEGDVVIGGEEGDQCNHNGDGKQALPLSLAQFLKRGRPAPQPGDNNATIVVHTFAFGTG